MHTSLTQASMHNIPLSNTSYPPAAYTMQRERPDFKGTPQDLAMITNFKRFKRKGSSSRFKGVFYVKKEKKYRAQICLKGKKTYIGTFKDDKEAALARDKKIREMFGEVEELLNFPKSQETGRFAVDDQQGIHGNLASNHTLLPRVEIPQYNMQYGGNPALVQNPAEFFNPDRSVLLNSVKSEGYDQGLEPLSNKRMRMSSLEHPQSINNLQSILDHDNYNNRNAYSGGAPRFQRELMRHGSSSGSYFGTALTNLINSNLTPNTAARNLSCFPTTPNMTQNFVNDTGMNHQPQYAGFSGLGDMTNTRLSRKGSSNDSSLNGLGHFNGTRRE